VPAAGAGALDEVAGFTDALAAAEGAAVAAGALADAGALVSPMPAPVLEGATLGAALADARGAEAEVAGAVVLPAGVAPLLIVMSAHW
jgi:uncharacterized membrane protein